MRGFPLPASLVFFSVILVAAPARAGVYECLVEPVQKVDIRSPVEGLIARLHVQRGDRVRRGQLLVELESGPERSSLELARYRARMEGRISAADNRLNYARQKAQRQRELAAKGFISAQALSEAETELALAESELREADENRQLARREETRARALLSQRQLRSPLDGVVVDRHLNPGDLAESGTGRKPILSLAQIDPLRVEAILPVSAYGKVKRGMTGQVLVEGFGRYPAQIKVVDPLLDAASATFRVRLEMRGGENGPPGGIRCKVELQASSATTPPARTQSPAERARPLGAAKPAVTGSAAKKQTRAARAPKPLPRPDKESAAAAPAAAPAPVIVPEPTGPATRPDADTGESATLSAPAPERGTAADFAEPASGSNADPVPEVKEKPASEIDALPITEGAAAPPPAPAVADTETAAPGQTEPHAER